MEQLRGPINDSLLVVSVYPFISPLSLKQLVSEELRRSQCLEPGAMGASFAEHSEMKYGSLFSHQTPFLQLLQGAMQAGDETEGQEDEFHLQSYQRQTFFASYAPESNFQLLLRLQSQNCVKQLRTAEMDSSRAVDQLESCITHASESETRSVVHHHKSPATVAMTGPARSAAAAAAGSNERRKRKRPRPASSSKSAEEAESQRMTHIAVERNRRRLMNDHLATLRSLMPPSYVQRGDQASIIGGAIEFVKELEQHLLSLRVQKRLRSSPAVRSRSIDDEPCAPALEDGFFVSPQYTDYSQWQRRRCDGEEAQQEGAGGVDVEATLVQGHVNLKVAGRRHQGQLVRAIVAMEELRLSVLHLNITSIGPSSIFYSLNMKGKGVSCVDHTYCCSTVMKEGRSSSGSRSHSFPFFFLAVMGACTLWVAVLPAFANFVFNFLFGNRC
ncbi:hypothetical protein Cni_G18724 [Canna indica]|uniref:BHLH domain-containing protein n=1 Tax=Canna indica TaxID=4628 RepID=A0AAQ3KK12_9LILI|nr:hypothetical protein Cni_G18724 [Canna indica]